MHLRRAAIAAFSQFIAALFFAAMVSGQDYVDGRYSGIEQSPVAVGPAPSAPPVKANQFDAYPLSSADSSTMQLTLPAARYDGMYAPGEELAYPNTATLPGNTPSELTNSSNCTGCPNAGCDRPWGLTFSDIFPVASCDPSLLCRSRASDEYPNWGLTTLFGYDSFRGVSQGGWGVNGGHVGFNLGTRLGEFSEWSGIGAQAGGTFGVFNWAGTDYQAAHENQAELQGFVTYGLFRKPTETSNWNAGLVQDWMFNDNFSVFAENPTLSQLRGQVGYAISASNEFGVWGTLRVLDDTRTVDSFGPTTWRPIDQVSTYWHHKWYCGGPDSWISFGVPEQSRLAGSGSLGDWIANATAVCPFSDSIGLYVNVMYMHQSAASGDAGAEEDFWNFTTGIAFYPGHNARSTNVSGQRWMPLLPVANNGSFLVDASNWY